MTVHCRILTVTLICITEFLPNETIIEVLRNLKVIFYTFQLYLLSLKHFFFERLKLKHLMNTFNAFNFVNMTRFISDSVS